MSDRFTDRVAVITGGASGIGLAVATQIAAEGGRVALWDLNAGNLETARSKSGATYTHTVDVTDPAGVAEAHAATVERMGQVDILVTSAGIIGPMRPVSELPYEIWRHISAVNLDGTFLCCQAVVPAMRDRGYGRIATVASIAGKEGVPGGAAYGASKAGVISLTKTLSRELAPAGVIVNTVTPGPTETPMANDVPPEAVAMMKRLVPLGRFAAAQEIADVICFMVSESCSFTTGSVFDASGGRADY
ncbi:SDR family NAD(P)-dependent oxidoreductase [Paractinoplanes brasiliensis]|uniref:3-oxoacyl-[acyl-carrier protein] reductase n=1 Tax=Paractinoplanes brasiliensis TaxID=52695 RepID=A0A4R6JZM0_9ACTN|nr:SDR family NAD(P)-dependent oxidoreductase [Actinoplanes brasiliensis]TDO41221.1 3-oxoacyl-[acyl-carrier protein] reductase [Actinoplanes brasiliensis]GID27495.1 3-oxoacyl-ACP reductase [Actinoplanes brasiliensis]